MERFDIGEDDRLAWMVDAVQRGETVQIVREGAIVAQIVAPTAPSLPERRTPLFDPVEWEELHRLTASLRDTTGAETIRRLRDQDD